MGTEAAGGMDSDGPSTAVDESVVRREVRARLFGGPLRAVTVGRFRILSRIGEGAMGIVYAAEDPHLERRVALKLLHSHISASGPEHPLLREAKALARLAHPNVVAVHDIGEHEGQLFVAMELVCGATLLEWVDDAQPDWRRRVQMLVEAGRGLVAAHREGLLHRDFKPDNVVVGHDGRPRVLDFGLVDSRERCAPHRPMRGTWSPSGEELELSWTGHAGGIVGTPAFMPPEVTEGGKVGRRSDQFAFCVTLYRVLFGVAPFPQDDLEVLQAAIRAHRVRAPRRGYDVPQPIVDALLEGMHPEPSQRHDSMEALLDVLEAATTDRHGSRSGVDLDRFPHLGRYLLSLPEGLASYPEARCQAAVALTALSRSPLRWARGVLPTAVERFRDDPPAASERVPTVHVMAVLLAVYDTYLSSKREWWSWNYDLVRDICQGPRCAPLMRSSSAEEMARGAGRQWRHWHEGSEMVLIDLDEGGCLLELVGPPYLFSGAIYEAFCATVCAAFDVVTKMRVTGTIEQRGPSVVRFRLDWSAP